MSSRDVQTMGCDDDAEPNYANHHNRTFDHLNLINEAVDDGKPNMER